jgi:hypothetical protein
LENTDEDEGQSPKDHYGANSPCRDPEAPKREDSAVHDENGHFNECDVDNIQKFVCEEELEALSALIFSNRVKCNGELLQSSRDRAFPTQTPVFLTHDLSL